MNSLSGYDTTNTRTMGGNITLTDNSGTIISNGNVSCISLQVNGQSITQGGGGSQGLAGTITVGEVVKLPLDSNPTVVNSGSVNNAIFNFGIPTSGLTQAKLNSIDQTIHNTEAINYNSATDTTSMSSNFACLDIAVRDIVCADMTIASINSCGGIVSCGNINVGNVVCGTIVGGNIDVGTVGCGAVACGDIAGGNITVLAVECGGIGCSGIISTGAISGSALSATGNITGGGDIICIDVKCSTVHSNNAVSCGGVYIGGSSNEGLHVNTGGIVVEKDAVVVKKDRVFANDFIQNESGNSCFNSIDAINNKIQYMSHATNSTDFAGNISSDTITCQTFSTPTSHAINIGVDGTSSNPNYINIGNFSGTTTTLNGDVNIDTKLTCQNFTTPSSRIINIGTDATFTNQNTINIGSFSGSTINLRGAIIMTDPEAFFFGQFISQFS